MGVDRAVGVAFLIAPFAFTFTGLDAWYYWINAGAILLVTSVLNVPEETRSIGTNTATAAQSHIA